MELNDYIFEKIDDYLGGNLTAEQHADFEKEMAAEPALREAVDMVRFEKDAGEYLLAKDLHAKVAEWEKNPLPVDEPKGNNNGIGSKWWLGLIAVALLAGLFYFLRNDNAPDAPPKAPAQEDTQEVAPERPIANEDPQTTEDTPKEENVAENKLPEKEQPQSPSPATDYSDLIAYVETEAYQLPPDLASLRSSGNAKEDNALIRGINAFLSDKKDYETAIKELESIDRTDALYERAAEILPHVYFKSGQYGKAAEMFGVLAETSLLPDEPEWYWLLSLMADYGKNKAQADGLLGKIVGEEGHPFQGKAEELKEWKDLELQ